MISVCCCCKVGTKKDATECFQCVHSLVPIFDLCKMLCAGLGEHLLVELEARLKAMDIQYDGKTLMSLNGNIRNLMIAAGYWPDKNENDTLKLLNDFSVRTDKSKIVPTSAIPKNLVCQIRNLPTTSFKCEAVHATRNIGRDKKNAMATEMTKILNPVLRRMKYSLLIIQQSTSCQKQVDILLVPIPK